MNKIRSTKGITLISLVITIIVLIILAGISIAMLTGENGILGKASKAKEESLKAEALEDIKIKVMEAQANHDGKATLANIVETLTAAQEKYKVITKTKIASLTSDSVTTNVDSADSILVTNKKYGKEVEVTKSLEISLTGTEGEGTGGTGSGTTGGEENGESSGSVVTNKTLAGLTTGFSSQNPVIPGGFTIVDTPKAEWKYKDDAKTEVLGWNDGLVIKDGEGNEFVWVPCSESNYKKINWGDSYKNNSWDETITTTEREQITKYGGFYVARYEAGSSNVKLTNGKKIGDEILSANEWQNDSYVIAKTTQDSKPTSKKGEIPYFHVDFFTAMVMSKNMYEDSNTVNSNLITGTQWDVMINWMSETSDKSDLKTNCNWGNYNNTELSNVTGKYCTIDSTHGTMTSAWQTASWTGETKKPKGYYLLTTGATEDANKKNIYDVAGNLWEWTNEIAGGDTTRFMMRGGDFLYSYLDYPVCYRYDWPAPNTATDGGFRPVLYIK